MVPTGEFLTVIRFLLIITLGKQTHTKTFSDKSESMVTLYGRKVGVSGGSVVKKKKSACPCRRPRLIPGWGKLLRRRKWQTHS